MERMRENPRVREWWALTDRYVGKQNHDFLELICSSWQESMVPDAQSSEAGEPSWWKPVEEIFYQP